MRKFNGLLLACAVLSLPALPACVSSRPITGESARVQVEATERAFAKTMADRDFAAFQRFVADEAVFFSDSGPLRGKAAVAARWAGYFDGAAPPFSWEPDQVEVLASGTLALSTGPVRNPQGQIVARFASIWRQERPGVWRIVFDRGESAGPR